MKVVGEGESSSRRSTGHSRKEIDCKTQRILLLHLRGHRDRDIETRKEKAIVVDMGK